MIFLRILGIAMLVPSWRPMFSSRPVAFHRSSRAPASLGSKLTLALAATVFCVSTFAVRPQLCAILFAICVLLGFWYSKRDQWDYEKKTGRLSFRPTGQQERVAFFTLDMVFLVLFLSFVVRDQIWHPDTEEERIIHYLCWGVVVFTAIAALLLYPKRPRRNASEN